MELTEGQQVVMASEEHLLVTGEPGSGKTTVAILKAAQMAEHLRPGQKILFLSFARATVSRVMEAIEQEQAVQPAKKRLIEVDTYHSFIWRLLKTHGYLVGLPRRLSILTPPSEAVALSQIRSQFPAKNLSDQQKQSKKSAETEERTRLATIEGRICFDLFAHYAGNLLHGSERIRRLVSTLYPVIILDEFQDTNAAQWRVVQALGVFSRLMALADPEQRIYDWVGADPARLDHLRSTFTPMEVDLRADNHRSAGTEIALFGNDLLTGRFRQPSYAGIVLERFEAFPDPAMTKLVTTIYSARTRLVNQGNKDWSLAILVPTKRMTRLVSDALRHPPANMTSISHVAVIEMEAAILGAEIIALLMQPASYTQHFEQFITLMCRFFQGKDGDKPTKKALQEAANIRKAYSEWSLLQAKGKPLRKSSILMDMLTAYSCAISLKLTGDPDRDWSSIRHVLESGACPRLKSVAEEVRNIRVLDRGTRIRSELSQDWLTHGYYSNAHEIIQQAFVREHFSTNTQPEAGVIVMNMHKAKGKQFDEVIIFEGWPRYLKKKVIANPDRIVRANSRDQLNDQARQNLRVSVTRAKHRTTILTPARDPCILLPL